MCPNPFPVPETPDERAAPVDRNDVTMEEFSKFFGANVTGNADEAGDYTCLRIKYKISEFGKIFFCILEFSSVWFSRL